MEFSTQPTPIDDSPEAQRIRMGLIGESPVDEQFNKVKAMIRRALSSMGSGFTDAAQRLSDIKNDRVMKCIDCGEPHTGYCSDSYSSHPRFH
jgi:hypothetical protein